MDNLTNAFLMVNKSEQQTELLVAKLLIVHINNRAMGMLDKSEPLEAYPSEGFR